MIEGWWALPALIYTSSIQYLSPYNRKTMARITNKSVFNALSGRIGKELVIKQYGDKVVVSKYPDMSKVKPSKWQMRGRERIKEATAYALSILNDPHLKAAFEKELKPGESVYHKAKKQYFEKLKQNNALWRNVNSK